MKIILKLFRKLFPSFDSFVKSALVGVSTGLLIFINNFQRHFLSKLYLGYTLMIIVTATIIAALIRELFLNQKIKLLKKSIRISVYFFSLIFAIITFANYQAQIQPIYYLLPDTQLQIRIPAEEIQEGQETVRLLRIDTGQGFVHYTDLDFNGNWQREEKNIIFPPDQEVIINWVGKVGPNSEIAFRKTTYTHPIYISWNGIESEYDLNRAESVNVEFQDQLNKTLEPDYAIQDKHNISLIYYLPNILSSIVSYGFCFLVIFVFLGTWSAFGETKKKPKKYAWLAFMLPILLVWGFSLLVFWPGILSNDSITYWIQAANGQHSEWGSAFYSLMLGFLMKLWNSPAVVSILQIFILSFLVTWGLKILRERGVPPIILYTISVLFAILPINNIYIITLWRDIPYSIIFLWLTIQILDIYLSNGEWVQKKNWLWLALSSFLLSVLRQNGIPVVILVFIILIVVYRDYAKEFVKGLVLFLCLLYLFKGPIYSVIDVDRNESGHENLIFLHHIAAHLDAGTELNAEEEEYLNSLLPVSDWFYYSCYVGPISYDDQFERERFFSNSALNREIALDLFLKDPLVNITHTIEASELVWRFANNQCIMKSLHGFGSWKPGEVSWVIQNDLGVKHDSKIPSVVQPYVDFLRVFGIRDDFLVSYLRPALYLYLGIFSTAILMIRRKDLRAWLLILPLVAQSAFLFLISYAPAVRYQYSNYLIGLFLLSVLFVPEKKSFERKDV